MSGPDIRVDRTRAGVGIVELSGEHDVYTRQRLEDALAALLGDDVDLVVDLGAATFLGAANVEVLLAASASAKARGHDLVLVVGGTTGYAVRRVIELAKLESVIAIAPSRESAFERLH